MNRGIAIIEAQRQRSPLFLLRRPSLHEPCLIWIRSLFFSLIFVTTPLSSFVDLILSSAAVVIAQNFVFHFVWFFIARICTAEDSRYIEIETVSRKWAPVPQLIRDN
jgi:hypothetical protein